MRMRYRHVTYRYIDRTQNQLEQRYRQMIQEVLQQSQQAMLQRSKTWRPVADIFESANMMTVKVELAGMQEEDIEVTLYEDALVVSGERHDDHAIQDSLHYHEAQIRYGPFCVEVFIASPIQRDAVAARYENGFLTVDLPKLPMNQPERIPIQRSNQKD
ncbi:MAG TPA: Hsp20/alpha crystallin family protein [Ktedonobacteraceae bacterium]|nr:Hsp20/alpha crystallin family protein [Ktedonobacteraceae bacterium]